MTKNGGEVNYSEYTVRKFRERLFSNSEEYAKMYKERNEETDYIRPRAEAQKPRVPQGEHNDSRDKNESVRQDVIDINPCELKTEESEKFFSAEIPDYPKKEDKENFYASGSAEIHPPNMANLIMRKHIFLPSNKNSYSKKKISFPKKIIVGLCVICILLCGSFMIAGGLADNAIFAYLPIGGYAATYYAVCTGEYEDMNDAKNHALKIMEQGAAGYVVYDGNYKVIAAVYIGQADAEKVKERIDGASIYKIKMKKVSLNKYTDSEQSRIRLMLNYADTVYGELYGISNALDDNSTDIAAARNKIALLVREINIISSSVSYSDRDKPIFLKIKNDLIAAEAALSYLLTNDALRPNFTANIRYTYVMILNIHRAFLPEV
ncbi:MAG: hypothetical protein LBQ27_02195 [Clostridiales bacterium]|jgi:hypothetical protein|nr:hypothetical protein [Clostridiales bacterium]